MLCSEVLFCSAFHGNCTLFNLGIENFNYQGDNTHRKLHWPMLLHNELN